MRNQRKSNSRKASTRKIAQTKKTTTKPVVRTSAKVTFAKPVNGTVAAKKRRSPVRTAGRSGAVHTDQFPKHLLAEVHTKLRPNERLIVLSATEARTVYTHN